MSSLEVRAAGFGEAPLRRNHNVILVLPLLPDDKMSEVPRFGANLSHGGSEILG